MLHTYRNSHSTQNCPCCVNNLHFLRFSFYSSSTVNYQKGQKLPYPDPYKTKCVMLFWLIYSFCLFVSHHNISYFTVVNSLLRSNPDYFCLVYSLWTVNLPCCMIPFAKMTLWIFLTVSSTTILLRFTAYSKIFPTYKLTVTKHPIILALQRKGTCCLTGYDAWCKNTLLGKYSKSKGSIADLVSYNSLSHLSNVFIL